MAQKCRGNFYRHSGLRILSTVAAVTHGTHGHKPVVVTVAAIGKRVDTASTNHRSLRLFTAPSAVSCQQEFTATSNQRRAVGELLDADWRAGPPESRRLFLLIAKK